MKKESYIVYDSDERPVCVGTIDECAEFMGISRQSLYTHLWKVKAGKLKGKGYTCYKIEEYGSETNKDV